MIGIGFVPIRIARRRDRGGHVDALVAQERVDRVEVGADARLKDIVVHRAAGIDRPIIGVAAPNANGDRGLCLMADPAA